MSGWISLLMLSYTLGCSNGAPPPGDGDGGTERDGDVVRDAFTPPDAWADTEPPPLPDGPLYFVDQAHPSASDDNDGLSEDTPLLTIGRALSLAMPGDTVVIKNGEYFEDISPVRSGEPERPITIRAYPEHRPVIAGSVEVDVAAFRKTEGLEHIYEYDWTEWPVAGVVEVDADAPHWKGATQHDVPSWYQVRNPYLFGDWMEYPPADLNVLDRSCDGLNCGDEDGDSYRGAAIYRDGRVYLHPHRNDDPRTSGARYRFVRHPRLNLDEHSHLVYLGLTFFDQSLRARGGEDITLWGLDFQSGSLNVRGARDVIIRDVRAGETYAGNATTDAGFSRRGSVTLTEVENLLVDGLVVTRTNDLPEIQVGPNNFIQNSFFALAKNHGFRIKNERSGVDQLTISRSIFIGAQESIITEVHPDGLVLELDHVVTYMQVVTRTGGGSVSFRITNSVFDGGINEREVVNDAVSDHNLWPASELEDWHAGAGAGQDASSGTYDAMTELFVAPFEHVSIESLRDLESAENDPSRAAARTSLGLSFEDYTPLPGSPVCGAGEAGGDIGAIDCGG